MNWLDAGDLLIGFAAGMWCCHHYYKPVLPVKVTIIPQTTEPSAPKGEWMAAVERLHGRLRVAAEFGDGFHFNALGARNVAMLIKTMATKLDIAVELGRADPPEKETAEAIDRLTT
jgi:hypothetical protein